MKLTKDTRVEDILLDRIEMAALGTLQDAVHQIEVSGSIKGVECHYWETTMLLDGMTDNDSEKKKEMIAGLLPPWFFEIKKILKEHE